MDERPNVIDQAERIRRLQERRAASGRSRPTASDGASAATATAPRTSSRRRHPAAGTRIFLAGLSVSSFFAVAGAIGLAHRSTSSVQTVSAANPAGIPSSAGLAATPGTASAAVVHTVTKAS